MIHFVGIDNGNKTHCVNIMNHFGETINNLTIENNLKSFQQLLEKLKNLKDVHIGIESTNNLLTDFLYKNGYKLYNLNPLKIKRFKEVYVISGNKTDKIDSEVLSDYLRMNYKSLKALRFSSEPVQRLKHFMDVHDQLTKNHTRYVNQLICTTRRCFPILSDLFSCSAPKILLKMILHYPTWGDLKTASNEEITTFLKKNYYRVPKYIEKVLQIIKNHDQEVDPGVEIAYQYKLKAIAVNLLNLKENLAGAEKQMDEILHEHALGDVFLSLPGAGSVIASKLLALTGDCKDRFESADNMRCLFGTAPRNYQSGGYHKVSMRRACKKQARRLLYTFAFSSLKHSVWARNYYDRQRNNGKTNSVALRSLSDRWLRKIFFIWKNEVLYDEDLAQKHAA